MARIFCGNRAKIDRAVLETVRSLPDDFWVLSEFDLNGRNIDWLLVRPVPDTRPTGACAVIILTELKRTTALLDGAEHGRWCEQRNGLWAEVTPSNMADENPWQQTINTQQALCVWLHNNQRRFLPASAQPYPPNAFRAWPTLLILSEPPDLIHRLPLRPQSRFGQFHYDLADWLATVRSWEPRVGLPLTAADLSLLVAALGLRELAPQCPHASARRVRVGPATPAMPPAAPGLAWLPDFVRWATDLDARVRALETRLATLEATPAPPPPSAAPSHDAAKAPTAQPRVKNATKAAKQAASAVPAAPSATTSRALTPEERGWITAALATLRAANKAGTIGGLFVEIARLNGGITLKQQRYNGFRTAKAMLDRAVAEGVIHYGPPDATGAPTLYFPHETIPQAKKKG